jgi:hypothetical protein
MRMKRKKGKRMRKCKFDTTLECSLDHIPTKSECIACALWATAEAFSNEQKERRS